MLEHLIRAPILVRVNHLKKKTLFKFLVGVKINFTSRLSRSNQQPIQPSKNIINNNHENLSSVTDLLRNSRNAINHLTAITPELTNHEKYSSKRKWILEEKSPDVWGRVKCILWQRHLYINQNHHYIVNSLINVLYISPHNMTPIKSVCLVVYL